MDVCRVWGSVPGHVCLLRQTVWQCYTLRYVLGLGFGFWPCKAFQSTVHLAVLYDVFSRLGSSS